MFHKQWTSVLQIAKMVPNYSRNYSRKFASKANQLIGKHLL